MPAPKTLPRTKEGVDERLKREATERAQANVVKKRYDAEEGLQCSCCYVVYDVLALASCTGCGQLCCTNCLLPPHRELGGNGRSGWRHVVACARHVAPAIMVGPYV